MGVGGELFKLKETGNLKSPDTMLLRTLSVKDNE